MGRPRKEAGVLDAKERIFEAFWKLLKTYKLHEITVGMISGEADCNRGTFYYHFKDIDDLVSKAINRELFSNKSISRVILRVACGDKTILNETEAIAPHFANITLLAQQGGGEIIISKVKDGVIKVWEIILGVKQENFTPSTRLIIEYAVSGIIGVLVYSSENPLPVEEHLRIKVLIPFIETNSKFLFRSICEAQNLNIAEVELRLRTMVRFLELSNYSLDVLNGIDTSLLNKVMTLQK